MPFEPPDLQKLIATLEGFKPGAPLEKFIGEVVFPNFKSISPGTRISLTFPLTALVGANGTGKSSILHALYGMPLRQSTSRFWFSTAVDPIEDGGTFGVPRYFYKHWISTLKSFVETRKVRGRKRTDYWEPARALVSDGMQPMPLMIKEAKPFRSKDRWNPTNRPVKYINFKCEFSAFDRYFYYPYHTETRAERQKRFRDGAKRLKVVISRSLTFYAPGGKNAVFENRKLTNVELEWVSFILGREYVKATYVLHELYGRSESPSILFERADAVYSEAFAGSGELAVVRAVMEVVAAEQFTLVLLDEPETSLHPSAQVRLISFLMKMIVEKHLQIVISTHSPTIVDMLPNRAIKVLEEGPSGKSQIIDVTHPQVAFNRLGHVGGKILIVAEDALIRSLLTIAMSTLDEGEQNAFEIYVPPGGADAILAYTVPALIDEGRSAFVLLDGDKLPPSGIPDPATLSMTNYENGKEFLSSIFGVRPAHIKNRDPKSVVGYLNWASNRIFYLDAVCPEFVFLEAIDPGLVSKGMTNQQAKTALIKELNRLKKPTDAAALAVAAQWQIPPTNPHIQDLRSKLLQMLVLA